jgi:hypothetical protein
MAFDAELAARMQNVPGQGPLVDPKAGRTWQIQLGRVLGGAVHDETRYSAGRAYRFDFVIPTTEEGPFASTLRVLISGAGPFVTHLFLLRSSQKRWWCNTIRTSRTGFAARDAEVLARLRSWYAEQGLTEVDAATQAQPVPSGLGEDPEMTLYQFLFLP